MAASLKPQASYYELLGVTPDATGEEIHTAFVDLIRQHREPPRDRRDRERSDRARQINFAYAVLGDARKRRAYDEELGIEGSRSLDDRPMFGAFAIGAGAAEAEKDVLGPRLEQTTGSPEAKDAQLNREPAFLSRSSNSGEADEASLIAPPSLPSDVPADRYHALEPDGLEESPSPPEELVGDVEPSDSLAAEDDAYELIAARDWDRPRRGWILAAVAGAAILAPASFMLWDRPQVPNPPAIDELAGAKSDVVQQPSMEGAVGPVVATDPLAGPPRDAAGGPPGSEASPGILRGEAVQGAETRPEGVNSASEGSELSAEVAGAPSITTEPEAEGAASELAQPPPEPVIVLEPPRPRPSHAAPPRWIGGSLVNSDNPSGRFVGAVEVRLQVSPNGRVSNCAIIRGSGNAALDATTCRLVQQRLRFAPARNADGQPVESHVTTTYTWGRRTRR